MNRAVNKTQISVVISVLCAMVFYFDTVSAQIIDIKTRNLSMIMGVNTKGELLLHHFGGKITDSSAFVHYSGYPTLGPTVYSTLGGRNIREPALRVTHADGDLNTELKYVAHSSRVLQDPNVTETIIRLSDRKQAFSVELVYRAYARENVITTHSIIRNSENGPVTLHNFYSSCLSFDARSYLLTHLWGAWAAEAQVAHTLLTPGTKSIESRKLVRTTHTENSAFMITFDSEAFDENRGEVLAGALAWSGNFKLNFELDEYCRLNILAGINPYASEYRLHKGDAFVTPEMVYTYSFEGAGGASRNLHDWARNYNAGNGCKYCPTLLNSWEGTYLDVDTKTIVGMIDNAAAMGLEMFVLDDGWFGNKYPRDDMDSGIGDWCVNHRKIPEGIDYLASYAHRKGLKFGIWIEPEMVNPRSEIAEAHPDWIVKFEGREVPTMRSEWLLDMSNPAVQDFVFDVFDGIMKMSPYIAYVKWDANRHAVSVGSAYHDEETQSHFWVDYNRGFYSVLERIRAKYPDVMLQGCASGGGRVEYGALKYFDEAWTSDNTEAFSRAKIQYGTSLFYPATVMGSHVSAVPNHQTGNITPLKFRFDIACAGRLGMELQPGDMTDEEKAFALKAIANYKSYRDIIMYGDLYRIESPYDGNGYYSVIYISKDKKRAVVFAYCLEYKARLRTPKFRLRGLDPEQNYVLQELNIDKPRFWGDGRVHNGSFLINNGINPQLTKLYDSAIYLLEAK